MKIKSVLLPLHELTWTKPNYKFLSIVLYILCQFVCFFFWYFAILDSQVSSINKWNMKWICVTSINHAWARNEYKWTFQSLLFGDNNGNLYSLLKHFYMSYISTSMDQFIILSWWIYFWNFHIILFSSISNLFHFPQLMSYRYFLKVWCIHSQTNCVN